MKKIELIEKRKPREKHFLQEDGTIIAEVYDDDVHYLKDGKYEEIDNSLIEENGSIVNKNNSFKVSFNEESKDELMKMECLDHYLNIKLKNKRPSFLKKVKANLNHITEVGYEDAIDNVDLEYKVLPTKVKESIIIKTRDNIPSSLIFDINSDLTLKLNDDKTVSAIKDGKCIFNIDAPYMIDAQNNINDNVYYKLAGERGKYSLELILDKEWLNSQHVMYPVVIDPTITKYSDNNSCYDTYIYPGDTNVNRNNHEYLKAGVEKVNGSNRINRALLKFDLPSIGTGSQIIKAELKLVGYPILYTDSGAYNTDIINIHRITVPWTETGANWNNMNSNYDSKIEGTFRSYRSIYYTGNPITPSICGDDITSLVKKWYSSDLPNYGIMLKMNTETYHTSTVPQFYSNNNNNSSNPKPILSIAYRNQNGLESYMHYKTQKFSQGIAYVNSYNGNLTTIFDICQTIGGKLPAALKLVYNTNDVVLQNNIGCGLGYMFNFNQTIKEESIDGTTYLSYIDSDGTIHYFYEKDNIYKDEDGLNLKIEKSNSKYILTEKTGNTMLFNIDNSSTNQIGYLDQIKNPSGDMIQFQYSNNLLSKIIDANNQEINITYGTNIITIFSPEQTVYLDYSNNKLTSIRSIYGDTTFTYNNNNIITKITDPTGLSFSYDYYGQSPYRLKKVTQYGLNNEEGRSFDIEYNFNSTTYTENNQKVTTMTFNNFGNLISMSNLKSAQNLTDAYGKYEEYGESYMTGEGEFDKYKNKVLATDIPFKYIKNYLLNSSFEKNSIDFQASSNVSLSITTEYSEIGLSSLKIISSGTGNRSFSRNVSVPKGKYYTFSGYFKNDNNLKLSMYYLDSNNQQVFSNKEEITPSNDFNRYDVSLYYPESATSNIYILVENETNGTAYLDCVQLEEGEVANSYNMLENSDFSNGFDGWQLRYSDIENYNGLVFVQPVNNIDPNGIFEIVDVGNGINAIKVNMNPKYSTEVEATLNLKGKKDESYNISFWYKNKGLPTVDEIGEYKHNTVSIDFNYTEEILPHDGIITKGFNPNDDEWQYFQKTFTAEENFDQLRLNFYQYFNANEIYITNMTLIKSFGKTKYDYDNVGNIINNVKSNNDSIEYSYDKNNQLVKATADTGINITNEYDNLILNRILSSINPIGLKNEKIYDINGNVKTYRSINIGKNEIIESGNYRIRLKGTSNFLASLKYNIVLSGADCNHYLWVLEKNQVVEQINDEQVIKDVYKIKHPILNKYIKAMDDSLILSSSFSFFELSKNKDGSFHLIDYDTRKYIKATTTAILLTDLVDDDYSFEFYFENTNKLFLEKNKTYTSDGRFVTSYTDSLLNTTSYDVNITNGLTNSITNPYGITTYYNYDNKRRLSKITQTDRVIDYAYNVNNALQSITYGNKQYNYVYDNFLNISQFKIGNVVLINNTYEQKNGNLISSTYGNNHSISYLYDDFDRLKNVTLMNDSITYEYGDNGNLLQAKSNDYIYKYVYDLSKKLREYRFNNFRVKFDYNNNNKISNKKYKLNNITYEISNIFDDTKIITSMFDNDEIIYSYDDLGRIVCKNLNNNYLTNYTYVNKGNRTSLLVKDNIIGNDIYSYRYNRLNNITHIYKNNQLIKRYIYNEHCELITENDYVSNKKTSYEYDNYGNILSVKIYNLTTENLISQILYEYNNSNWPDLLTKFNNETITYDAIGNPLTIGNKTLTWINGKQLQTYSDGVNNISYKYGKNGVRTEKIVNNVTTNYYMEDSRIIFEKTGNNCIVYLYDGYDNLIGLKYNGNKYYYIKNMKEDIIGIMDSNYNIIAKYEYNAYGKIISIADANNNDISNNTNHIANINPFRYRSYYYDKETQLYYLRTRYYNPEWCRFINTDSIVGITEEISGYNLFLYCNNNPIDLTDSNGNIPLLFIPAIVTLALGATAVALSYLLLPASTEMIVVDSLLRRNKDTYTKEDMVVKEMASSPKTKKAVENQIQLCEQNSPECNSKFGVYYYDNLAELDLALSVGSVYFVIDDYKLDERITDDNLYQRRYIATIHVVEEEYSFPEVKLNDGKLHGPKDILNAFGYRQTENGVLTIYEWSAKFDVETDWVTFY